MKSKAHEVFVDDAYEIARLFAASSRIAIWLVDSTDAEDKDAAELALHAIAREGEAMSAKLARGLEPPRRAATVEGQSWIEKSVACRQRPIRR